MPLIEKPMTEAEWQARDDARTLARAEEIKADESRLQTAQDAAKKMLDEQRDEAKALSKVAGRGSRNNTGRQPALKQRQGRPSSTHNVFRRI